MRRACTIPVILLTVLAAMGCQTTAPRTARRAPPDAPAAGAVRCESVSPRFGRPGQALTVVLETSPDRAVAPLDARLLDGTRLEVLDDAADAGRRTITLRLPEGVDPGQHALVLEIADGPHSVSAVQPVTVFRDHFRALNAKCASC